MLSFVASPGLGHLTSSPFAQKGLHSNSTEVGTYDTSWIACDVYVSDSMAYVADGSGGLIILRYVPYSIYLPVVVKLWNH